MSDAYEHGHDHDHEHSHDHEHGHDHDHNHNHNHNHAETLELTWAFVEIEAHTHEQAATVSMRVRPKAESTTTFADLVAIMQDVARSAEDRGGIIGHIKAFARSGDDFVRASVTTADIDPVVEGDQQFVLSQSADIELVSIVMLVDQDSLLAICKDALR